MMQESMFHFNGKSRASICSLGYFSLLFCTVISGVLVLFYLYSIKPYVSLPADILSWAETNFVGDIIKLRIGAPFYTPPADSNSLVYTPGAPLMTYGISKVIGKNSSLVAWRVIQLAFIFFGALIATACCHLLNRLAYREDSIAFPKTWLVFTFFAMFLTATAPRVNSFSHTLQAEALALLVSMFTFLTILIYLKSPSWKNVILMALCPALGYLTKQNLISWSVVIFVFLLLNNPRNLKHQALFVVTAVTLIGIAIGVCYLLWGDAFIFWTFEIMGGARKKIGLSPSSFNLSLSRSLDHVIRAWMEIALGVVGGWLILRGENIRKLGPLWIAWIVLLSNEALISGVNWGPLYHFGSGVVIGAIWLFAALPQFWPKANLSSNPDFSLFVYDKTRPLIAVVGVMTIFVALHVLPTGDQYEARYWKRHSLSDVYRYISDIEREFENLPAEQVLLDIGNWIYLRHSILAKDRAISLADQPPGGIYENLDVMVSRIRRKAYAKILVRDLHSPFFPYDWFSWEKPSGVKKALKEHYVELRTIPAVKENTSPLIRSMQTGPVSVLVPKPNPESELVKENT